MKPHHILPIVAVTLTAFTQTTHAKGDAARLSVQSDGNAEIEIISTSDGAKIINQSPKNFELDQDVTPGEWTTISAKFKASEETAVRLRLSATWTRDDDVRVFIDNVKGEGVEIENPDFEEGGGKVPAGWKSLKGKGSFSAAREENPEMAASGAIFMKVSHDSPIIQMIQVPKDTEVTVSFAARLAPNEE